MREVVVAGQSFCNMYQSTSCFIKSVAELQLTAINREGMVQSSIYLSATNSQFCVASLLTVVAPYHLRDNGSGIAGTLMRGSPRYDRTLPAD